METDISTGPIGAVGQYDLAFRGGKLTLSVSASEPVGSVLAAISVDAGTVIDAIAKAIPGTVDDAILGLLKAALLGT